MSRAFVKEDGPEPSDDPPERPVSDLPNYVTRRGLGLLETWEEKLIKEHADLPADKTDPVVRKRKLTIERDLRYVRARLDNAIPVDAAPKDEIRFGAVVKLKEANGAERIIRIVGEDEADAGGEMISWASPFANALLGLKIDQTATWNEQSWTVQNVNY